MIMIEPSYEIWEDDKTYEGMLKHIERCARVCYKSEDKITENSAKPFIERMIQSKHLATLEHGTVYLSIPAAAYTIGIINRYKGSPYSRVNLDPIINNYLITTNYRVIIENGWTDDLIYVRHPSKEHAKRYTVHFICDRGILSEFTRHRTFSFCAESTRYCNYSKDKFGNEISFIIPWWTNLKEGHYSIDSYESEEYYTNYTPDYSYTVHLLTAEATYFRLLEDGWKPQEARNVLPLSLKTELVMTGFVSDWEHFFRLRSRIAETGKPHPQAQELADPLMDEFIKRGIIKALI